MPSEHQHALSRVTTWLLAVCIVLGGEFGNSHSAFAHDGVHQHAHSQNNAKPATSEAEGYLHLFKQLIARWPMTMKDDIVHQAWREHQFVHKELQAPSGEQLEYQRQELLGRLETSLPSVHISWDGTTATLSKPDAPISICRAIASPLLITIHNQSKHSITCQPILNTVTNKDEAGEALNLVSITAGSQMVVLTETLISKEWKSDRLSVKLLGLNDQSQQHSIDLPVRIVESATIRGKAVHDGSTVPARITVQCSDGVCRYGGRFANKSTFTDKPIIYPPIGGIQKTAFFYTDGTFELTVPPGNTRIVMERGFDKKRSMVEVDAQSDQIHTVNLSCESLVDMDRSGWVSGDTHVHWVTNAWNVDEPLDLLALIQRAEGLRVANNLTLLQRYANQAFIKPSQAPMGPVARFSDAHFHVEMGEEYRNENLYGHLCFLNIDWLVQPIGTGSIIAGPDALDYPLNRTAIEACREQGGISIEAHGTGGNKDVPVNVIHNLTDSLDQMEPSQYYRLLDCGFRLPLTNGSDHPARTLGIARAYVKVDGEFSYQRWIEGIRLGRTFTTSGPLIFLTVNDANIGDVITAGARESLQIKARVVSRDPIGRFQIVSNGEVIAERETEATSAEIKVEIPAGTSRWIVARCSRRTDGREDFGFGNYNAITGPGIAHTSPVYVEVDGRPRFDSAAADYWQDRMRLHLRDVESKGRFANKSQREEVVTFLNNGMRMFAQLERQLATARSRKESIEQSRNRLANVLRRFGNGNVTNDAIRQLKDAETRRDLDAALKPLTLLAVFINPEARVKVRSFRDRITVHQDRPQRFLVRVDNVAGITAPLRLSTLDLATDPLTPATWCHLEVVDSPFTSRYLSGAEVEYKVVEMTPHQSGLRELRIIGDAGQGTQDLGFRATTDVLVDVDPKGRQE